MSNKTNDSGALRRALHRTVAGTLVVLLCFCAPQAFADESTDNSVGADDSQEASSEQDLDDRAEEEREGQAEGSEEAPGVDPTRPPAPPSGPVVPDTPDDSEEGFARALEGFRDAHINYAREFQDYQDTIDAIVEAEFSRRMAQIHARYDHQIQGLEAIEREQRNEAIAAFRRFIDTNPNQPEHTPDALFRLAELHFEKANDDFMLADEAFQGELARYESGELSEYPPEPERSYAESMRLFERLINDWPEYRHVDGAYYLLAYAEQQMGNFDRARDLWATLIEVLPESRFVAESWLRIGEFHFDYSDGSGTESIIENLEAARVAYLNAMQDPGSPFYDKALYKLAWTYYRLDDYDQAIIHFQQLVEYSDEVERQTGRSGAVLREEAVQYIAIALAEEDWDLDGVRDDEFGMPRVRQYLRGEHDYEREVLVQLADFLFERTMYRETIELYQYMLDNHPLHRDNPVMHERIIIAYHRDGQPEAAFEVRRQFMDFYGPDSEWYAYQRRLGNDEALAFANNLVRDNILQAATWYHEQAQQLRTEALVRRDPDLLALTEARYALAAAAYEDFLRRYPDDREIFQWNFYYAECLYYSGQYEAAFGQYEVVRELDIAKNDFQEISAFNAVRALEFMMRDQVNRGQLTATALTGLDLAQARQAAESLEEQREFGEDERALQRNVVESERVPQIVEDYVTAMDRYVVLGLINEDDSHLDGKFAFQAAKVFYDFKHYDEARRRFAWVVENYSEHEVAYLAGSLILETYRAENDYAAMAEWADRLASVIKGEQAEAVRAEVREFRLGALFHSAESLYAEEKYDEAAAEYIRLVNDAPEHPFAPKALNNAAVAYEMLRRFDSAMRLYERVYREYPDDPLAGYAIFRVAVNSEQFFEFDKAIQHYQLFYDRMRGQSPPELAEIGFDVEHRRMEALKSVAVLQENLQLYDQAATSYQNFARAYPNDDSADDAMWQAVLVRKKADDQRRMVEAIQTFIREYGSMPANNLRVLEGMIMIADHHEARGDRRQSARWYQDTIREFERRGEEPASPAAYYAAKAQFMLSEHQFDQWVALQIRGSLRQQERLLQQKVEGQRALQQEYTRVMSYRNLEWTMAANFRIGSLLQQFAAALYEVPIPFAEGSEEFDIYQERLEDLAIPLEEAAIERYEQTIARARQDRIVNEWTVRTIEALNTFKPAEYPLYKEERRSVQIGKASGVPFFDAEGYERYKERAESRTDEGGRP